MATTTSSTASGASPATTMMIRAMKVTCAVILTAVAGLAVVGAHRAVNRVAADTDNPPATVVAAATRTKVSSGKPTAGHAIGNRIKANANTITARAVVGTPADSKKKIKASTETKVAGGSVRRANTKSGHISPARLAADSPKTMKKSKAAGRRAAGAAVGELVNLPAATAIAAANMKTKAGNNDRLPN